MLTDFDPDGEVKVVAAALYAVSDRADAELLRIAPRMTPDERHAVLARTSGSGCNRRHRPGRAFERTSYRFDVLADYGAFRDLQRHRLLTLEWQRLTPRHGSRRAGGDRRGGRDRTTGGARWPSPPRCTTRSRRPGCPRSPPTRCPWRTGSASTWK